MTSVPVSDKRCKNLIKDKYGKEIEGYYCNKKMFLDENGKPFCWYCKEIAEQDKQLAKETEFIHKKNDIQKLFESFSDNSLINEKLKKATFKNYYPPTPELEAAKKSYMDGFCREL